LRMSLSENRFPPSGQARGQAFPERYGGKIEETSNWV
jgi:hypothetical protein